MKKIFLGLILCYSFIFALSCNLASMTQQNENVVVNLVIPSGSTATSSQNKQYATGRFLTPDTDSILVKAYKNSIAEANLIDTKEFKTNKNETDPFAISASGSLTLPLNTDIIITAEGTVTDISYENQTPTTIKKTVSYAQATANIRLGSSNSIKLLMLPTKEASPDFITVGWNAPNTNMGSAQINLPSKKSQIVKFDVSTPCSVGIMVDNANLLGQVRNAAGQKIATGNLNNANNAKGLLVSIANSGTYYLIVYNNTSEAISSASIMFQKMDSDPPPPSSPQYVMVALTNNNEVHWLNGGAWTEPTINDSLTTCKAVMYSMVKQKFVIVGAAGSNGGVLVSSDGATWTKTEMAGTKEFISVAEKPDGSSFMALYKEDGKYYSTTFTINGEGSATIDASKKISNNTNSITGPVWVSGNVNTWVVAESVWSNSSPAQVKLYKYDLDTHEWVGNWKTFTWTASSGYMNFDTTKIEYNSVAGSLLIVAYIVNGIESVLFTNNELDSPDATYYKQWLEGGTGTAKATQAIPGPTNTITGLAMGLLIAQDSPPNSSHHFKLLNGSTWTDITNTQSLKPLAVCTGAFYVVGSDTAGKNYLMKLNNQGTAFEDKTEITSTSGEIKSIAAKLQQPPPQP